MGKNTLQHMSDTNTVYVIKHPTLGYLKQRGSMIHWTATPLNADQSYLYGINLENFPSSVHDLLEKCQSIGYERTITMTILN